VHWYDCDGQSVPGRTLAQRLENRVIVEIGGDDLVTSLQPESRDHDVQALGRAACDRDFVRIAAEVPGQPLPDALPLCRDDAAIDQWGRIDELGVADDSLQDRAGHRVRSPCIEDRVSRVEAKGLLNRQPESLVARDSSSGMSRTACAAA
jgi:hypothetical protein